MGKATGFMEYERKDAAWIEPEKRLNNFCEFHTHLSLEEQQKQGARCMECGVPFCQAGAMIAGMVSGCPLHNLIPEFNDLVYHGQFEKAYERLSKTHCFPEFTSRVCPALCEAACTCGIYNAPVATKSNEGAVIAYAFEHGLVKAEKPSVRTGKTIAVVGSGPAGLAVAQQLNKRGHEVTVFERSDRPGGLLRYGIPNMKLEKSVIDRRIALMEEAGIHFVCNVDVGKDKKAKELLKEFDRVVLACGASKPRDINVPGRDAKGIYFAVDFLKGVTKRLLDSEFKDVPYDMVKGKNVLVIGGGDTGNDCVGTAIRLGAKSVLQLEMMPMPPKERLESNPWPEWPKVLKTDYGQEEAIYKFGKDPRMYETTVTEFVKNKEGAVAGAKIVKVKQTFNAKTKRMEMKPVEGTESTLAVDLVLIAAGFLGTEGYITEAFGVKCNERTNVATQDGSYETNVKGVFAAGDMRRGQSLVVWAIAEGREAARAVDQSLMGYTNL